MDEHVDVDALGTSAQLAASLYELIDPDLAGVVSVQEGEEPLRLGHIQLEAGEVRLQPALLITELVFIVSCSRK